MSIGPILHYTSLERSLKGQANNWSMKSSAIITMFRLIAFSTCSI